VLDEDVRGILVAGQGVAPCSQAYEACVTLVHLPASLDSFLPCRKPLQTEEIPSALPSILLSHE